MTRDLATTTGLRAFIADLDEHLLMARECGALPNVHGVAVAKEGAIVYERYWPGIDFALTRPLGIVRSSSATRHDLRSMTKSVVALLYGLALERRLVPPPEAALLDAFPEHADLAADPQRRRLTIHHALTMALGIDWDESIPYSDPRNGEIAMERAPDRYRFVLERPFVEEPGTRWNYCGGATALLGRIIARGTGMALDEFARETLFSALGVDDVEWMSGHDGEALAAAGLRLCLPSVTHLGLMVLGGGRWQGRPVIPAGWLSQLLTPHIGLPDGSAYGYQWYVGAMPVADRTAGVRWERTVSAMGNGGQRLFVLPDLGLVVAVFAGNYDQADQWRAPTAVLRDVVLPAATRS